MVRNDDIFLRKWVTYYGRELGRENLYIFFDGEDQSVPAFCEGTNASLHPKIGNHVVKAEKARLKFLSEKATELFGKGYDLVIGVDADEYIVVDPKLGIGLCEFLSRQDIDVSLSPLGLDFGQRLGEEGDLSLDEAFLSQRRYAQIGTRYTKPSVIVSPAGGGAASIVSRDTTSTLPATSIFCTLDMPTARFWKNDSAMWTAWRRAGRNISTSAAAPSATPRNARRATSTAGPRLPGFARRGAVRLMPLTSLRCSN